MEHRKTKMKWKKSSNRKRKKKNSVFGSNYGMNPLPGTSGSGE
jgi:hypothetical protein